LCSDGTLVEWVLRPGFSGPLYAVFHVLSGKGVLERKTVTGLSGLLIQCSDGSRACCEANFAWNVRPGVEPDPNPIAVDSILDGAFKDKTLLSIGYSYALFKEPTAPAP